MLNHLEAPLQGRTSSKIVHTTSKRVDIPTQRCRELWEGFITIVNKADAARGSNGDPNSERTRQFRRDD